MKRRSMMRRALPWLVILGVFLVWEALCRLFGVKEFVLPLPSQIFTVLVKRWDALLPHATQTLMTTVIGKTRARKLCDAVWKLEKVRDLRALRPLFRA